MEREAAAVEDIVLQATGLKKSFGHVRALTDGSICESLLLFPLRLFN